MYTSLHSLALVEKMASKIPITIIRHHKERRSKCSLTPLEEREDIQFHCSRPGWTFDTTGFTILTLEAPELSVQDAGRPLLLLDSTWRLLPEIETCLTGNAIHRTLPAVHSAYPRTSKFSNDPVDGLASVEALFLAKLLLGERDDTLLENYYWRAKFMENLKHLKLLH